MITHTLSGKVLDVREYSSADINIEEIAISLARQRRYAGNTSHPWSVAQHMILCSMIADHLGMPENTIKACFLHDVEEGVIQDVVQPVKNGYVTDDFIIISDNVREVLFREFGVKDDYSREDVHAVDQIAWVIETFALRRKTFGLIQVHKDIAETALKLMEVDSIGIPSDLLMLPEDEQMQFIRSFLELFQKEAKGVIEGVKAAVGNNKPLLRLVT